ncbi:hypothetical protein ITJ44_15670 [Clavibacter sp. VKM Ac-2873]|uniref:sensor histidine kinase n=1 Tax=Clavibacter sp. VKM Ac-2873 TaxID=2783813 RepID=UPI00188C55DF|nr:ATP-binding protein [Clavibacter sp. VKM Ac-2873]MBF4619514.1 hypothetical protein [Clavibacter sp. VKM Ac-2873]
MGTRTETDALTALRSPRHLLSSWPLRFAAFQVTSMVMGLLGVAALLTPMALLVWVALFSSVERRRGRLLGYPVLPHRPAGMVRDSPARAHQASWDPAIWRALLSLVVTTMFGLVQLLLAAYCLMLAYVASVLPVALARYREDVAAGRPAWEPRPPILAPGLDRFRVTDTGAMAVWIVLSGIVVAAGWCMANVLSIVQIHLSRLLLSMREAELEQVVADLESSRSTLIASFDVDRVRIERDLHDGTQQHLVMTTLLIGSAARQTRHIVGDEDRTRALEATLEKAQTSVELALSDLRSTIRGVYSDVLTDHGLVVAIEELAARSTTPVVVRSTLDSRPGPALERCAHFVVSEAVTNALRHADASEIEIRLSIREGDLVVQVVDDGVGGIDLEGSSGTGLRGLRERARAAGGTLSIVSPPGGPTTITLELPVTEHGPTQPGDTHDEDRRRG